MSELGFTERDAARRALDAAIGALAETLTPEEARAFAASLPAPFVTVLRRTRFEGVMSATELYERARRLAGAAPARSREATQVALRAIGESLDEEALVILRRALPRDIAALLEKPTYGEPPPYSQPGSRTLASGRPGPRHPLSESHADYTHSQSLAAQNPHGDTKLSSARGTTQEREGRTIATRRT
jgi:uncharacterized protein (DUF2267 family)